MFCLISSDNFRINPMVYRVLALLTLLLLGGCSTMGYYYQSVQGHMNLMHKSRPIGELLDERDVDPELRKRLVLVLEIRHFASRELGLPENDSYRSFADLNRQAVVWNVVATPELSVMPKEWCYPVIGCASYRGYFKINTAKKYAASLKREGMDIAVEPAAAYSTLGWFDDPLPSTVINWPESQLVGLIIHELAHQQLYAKGDSTFNESFATAVEQVGVERWFLSRNDKAGFDQWRLRDKRRQQFYQVLLDSRERLHALYTSSISNQEKRERKRQEFQRLQDEYVRLKKSWQGYTGFDHWFRREVNNARLATVATYTEWVPAFLELLRQQGNDMRRFYKASARLADLDFELRRKQLQDLSRPGR